MKALMWLPTDSITMNPEYQNLFPSLSTNVYTELRNDIEKVGILVPLILEHQDSGYSVLAGHHRLKAAKEIGLAEVPCEIVETQEEQFSALFDNIHRRQLSPQELKELKRDEHVWRSERAKHIPSALKTLCEEFPLERILPASLWSQVMLAPASQVDHIAKSIKGVLEKVRANTSQKDERHESNLSRSLSIPKKNSSSTREVEEIRQTAVSLSKEVQKRNQEIEHLKEAVQAEKRKTTDAQALLHALEMQDPLTMTPDIIVDGFQTLSQFLRILFEWTTHLPALSDDVQEKIGRAITQCQQILHEHVQTTHGSANLRLVNGHKQSQSAHV
ncbi:MAG: hypothetical protein NPIRA04_04000 [Nitrospirales bacterium]|nr:MAG: hypothetical protein NPIRA04_04000 [Nitrospirales bacterium]